MDSTENRNHNTQENMDRNTPTSTDSPRNEEAKEIGLDVQSEMSEEDISIATETDDPEDIVDTGVDTHTGQEETVQQRLTPLQNGLPHNANDDIHNSSKTKSKEQSYITPVEDPYEKATKFLEKHQLLMLFQTLTADVVLKRPDDPLDFMIDEIEKLQEQDRLRKGVFLNVSKQTKDEADKKANNFGKDDIVGEDFGKLSDL